VWRVVGKNDRGGRRLVVRILRDKIDLHLALSDESMKLCGIVVGTILFGLRSVGTTRGPRGPKYCGLPTPNLKKSELILKTEILSTMSTGCELFRLNKLQQTTSIITDVYVNHQPTWLPTNQGQNPQIGKKCISESCGDRKSSICSDKH